MPVHLGSMPMSVRSAIDDVKMRPGDIVILNDPYKGGTHLPDITLVSPVYLPNNRHLISYLANRAHHSDVGGITPGSMPLATEIFQEGLRIPPLKLYENGAINPEVLHLILANVRTPQEREGDLTAQIAAIKVGERRLSETIKKYGIGEVSHYMSLLQRYSERMVRQVIREIPDGDYHATDFLDDDGISDAPIRITVTIKKRGDSAIVDFTGSAPQVEGGVNAVFAITMSAVYYVFRSITPYDIPANAGVLEPIQIVAPKGTVVDARFPGPTAAGNVETSQRIVDVLLKALAQAIPEKIPAASSGTMNNLTIGGIDPRTGRPYSYYETIGGGMGASPVKNGNSGVHTHMTNSLNTPVEALEYAFPFRVVRYGLRRGSAGQGRFRGGHGIVRQIEFLSDSKVTLLSDRRKFAPYGLKGGQDAKPGQNLLLSQGKKIRLASKVSIKVKKGDAVLICTPGGGGWGQ